jgi:hypothetical protein
VNLALLTLTLLAAEPAPAPAPAHELSMYLRSGLTFFTSSARTQGGLGGGVGVRDTLSGVWLLQADVQGLVGLGNALELRVGGGIQWPGWWSPAGLVHLTALLGDRLSFPTAQAPQAGSGPALALGATLAPLRFRHERVQVAVLQLSLGLGLELPGTGTLLGLTLLEVATAF